MARALLLLKELSQAKSRLASLLLPQQRQSLTIAMAQDVMLALHDCGRFSRMHAITGCELGRMLCEAMGVSAVLDAELDGICINTRVASWLQCAPIDSDEPVVALHADLPFLEHADIDRLASASDENAVAVATDVSRRGSNAIALLPGQLREFAWGEDSLRRHQKLCDAQGFECRVVDSPGIAQDIDTPADFALLARRFDDGDSLGPATVDLLGEAAFEAPMTSALAETRNPPRTATGGQGA